MKYETIKKALVLANLTALFALQVYAGFFLAYKAKTFRYFPTPTINHVPDHVARTV